MAGINNVFRGNRVPKLTSDKYLHHYSIIWSVWLNGWLFVHKSCGCGFESCFSHLAFWLVCIDLTSFEEPFKIAMYTILFILELIWSHVPVDTGRKLNVHKTFRRRPGRLLNVLCTFNLRPVSTGVIELNSPKKVTIISILVKSEIPHSIYLLERNNRVKCVQS